MTRVPSACAWARCSPDGQRLVSHTAAITSMGRALCWGSNDDKQLSAIPELRASGPPDCLQVPNSVAFLAQGFEQSFSSSSCLPHACESLMDGWATQVAWQHWWATWVQDSIMRQMWWPLPQGDAFDEADAEQEEGFHEIDINGELFRVSCDGVREVEKAMLADDCLRLQLAPVKWILEYVSDTAAWQASDAAYLPRDDVTAGDDVESRAAWALCHVDELLRQQADQEAPPLPALALESMKLLQRHLQDIALLACGRFVSQTILQSKGIQHELLRRLEAAFGQAALQDDGLWSRLGNSKFHCFTPGARFGERKHRHGRGGRKSRRLSQEADATAVAATDEPMFIDLPDLLYL